MGQIGRSSPCGAKPREMRSIDDGIRPADQAENIVAADPGENCISAKLFGRVQKCSVTCSEQTEAAGAGAHHR